MIRNLIRTSIQCRLFCGATRQKSTWPQDKLYELRTYSIEFTNFAAVMKLFNDYLHLRTAHSRLIGYWTVELGALNEVIHIWEYDNYDHRTKVRQALAQDNEWMTKFIAKAGPYFKSQQNIILYPFPWCPLNFEPSDKPRAFELLCHSLLPGRLPQWEHQVLQGWNERLQYSQPIGIWRSEFGLTDQVYQLWAYESFDKRMEVEAQTMQDEHWMETWRHSVLLTQSTWRKGLQPTVFSPLK